MITPQQAEDIALVISNTRQALNTLRTRFAETTKIADKNTIPLFEVEAEKGLQLLFTSRLVDGLLTAIQIFESLPKDKQFNVIAGNTNDKGLLALHNMFTGAVTSKIPTYIYTPFPNGTVVPVLKEWVEPEKEEYDPYPSD